MRTVFPRGITLIETTIYIALFMMIIPTFTLFTLHIWQQQLGFDARNRLEQTSALVFLELTHALTEADTVSVSTSTLGTDTSTLAFTDANGTAVSIALVTTQHNFTGTAQTVRRLQLTRGSGPTIWLTEPEHDVTRWRIDAVRSSAGTLTGLRIYFDAELLNASGNAYRNATFTADTTIALSPHTLEQ